MRWYAEFRNMRSARLPGVSVKPRVCFQLRIFFWPPQQNLWVDSGSGSRPKL
jgi:hypothetical protein